MLLKFGGEPRFFKGLGGWDQAVKGRMFEVQASGSGGLGTAEQKTSDIHSTIFFCWLCAS